MENNLKQPRVESEPDAEPMVPAEQLLLAECRFSGPDTQKQITGMEFGQIGSFDLPNGWSEVAKPGYSMGQILRMDFEHRNGANLSLIEKGRRISEEAGAEFVRSLNKPIDRTSKDRIIDLSKPEGKAEYAALNPVLAEELANSNTFRTNSVRVREINDRRVLEVIGSRGRMDEDGKWVDSGQKTMSLYIDKFGGGDAIQEIRLKAGDKSFTQVKGEVELSLKSLKWKKDNN